MKTQAQKLAAQFKILRKNAQVKIAAVMEIEKLARQTATSETSLSLNAWRYSFSDSSSLLVQCFHDEKLYTAEAEK